MKKKQPIKPKLKEGETEGDRVYSHIHERIIFLKKDLKMRYAFLEAGGNGQTFDETCALKAIRGLDYINRVLFDYLRNGDPLKEILEDMKRTEAQALETRVFPILG